MQSCNVRDVAVIELSYEHVQSRTLTFDLDLLLAASWSKMPIMFLLLFGHIPKVSEYVVCFLRQCPSRLHMLRSIIKLPVHATKSLALCNKYES